MANLVGGDIIQELRDLLGEPSANGRYTDLELYRYIDMAQTQVMFDVEWPQTTLSFTSDGTHGGPGNELALPEITSVLRVYINRQPIVPTSIPLLEGDQLGFYDQSTSTYQPQWNTQPFTAYPSANLSSYPDNVAMPFFAGQRPRYYLRENTTNQAIGFVPPPTAGWAIALDVYPGITPLATAGTPSTQATIFPQMFKEALSSRAAVYAFFGDSSSASHQGQAEAQAIYEAAKRTLIAWKAKLVAGLPKAPVVVPHRTYQTGPSRGPRSGFRMGN